MKSLEERKKYRKQQRIEREKLERRQVQSSNNSAPLVTPPSTNTDEDEFESMTIADLRKWIEDHKLQLPKEISKRDDILTWVRNADSAIKENPDAFAQQQTSGGPVGWQSSN